MTHVSILPERPDPFGQTMYRAMTDGRQAAGRTAGEALDNLVSTLPEADAESVIIVRRQYADQFFSADQQRRLQELMDRWRIARDQGEQLPSAEQAELDGLIASELGAATERSEGLRHGRSS